MSFECEVDGRNLSDKFTAMFKKKNRLKSGGGRIRCVLDQRDFVRTRVIGRVIVKDSLFATYLASLNGERLSVDYVKACDLCKESSISLLLFLSFSLVIPRTRKRLRPRSHFRIIYK